MRRATSTETESTQATHRVLEGDIHRAFERYEQDEARTRGLLIWCGASWLVSLALILWWAFS